MGTLHGIEICKACGEHEAQYADYCKWCYDVQSARKHRQKMGAVTKSKVSLEKEQEILDTIESAAKKVQIRTIEKGLKE